MYQTGNTCYVREDQKYHLFFSPAHYFIQVFLQLFISLTGVASILVAPPIKNYHLVLCCSIFFFRMLQSATHSWTHFPQHRSLPSMASTTSLICHRRNSEVDWTFVNYASLWSPTDCSSSDEIDSLIPILMKLNWVCDLLDDCVEVHSHCLHVCLYPGVTLNCICYPQISTCEQTLTELPSSLDWRQRGSRPNLTGGTKRWWHRSRTNLL